MKIKPLVQALLAECRVTRRSRSLNATVIAMLLASATTAGCGSGGSSVKSAAATPSAISKAQFLARANAICAKADPLLSTATAELANRPSRARVQSIVTGTFVPSVEAQITGIRALGTPTGQQANVVRMLGLVHADLTRLVRNPALVATDVFADFARVAHRYGLTSCAPLS